MTVAATIVAAMTADLAVMVASDAIIRLDATRRAVRTCEFLGAVTFCPAAVVVCLGAPTARQIDRGLVPMMRAADPASTIRGVPGFPVVSANRIPVRMVQVGALASRLPAVSAVRPEARPLNPSPGRIYAVVEHGPAALVSVVHPVPVSRRGLSSSRRPFPVAGRANHRSLNFRSLSLGSLVGSRPNFGNRVGNFDNPIVAHPAPTFGNPVRRGVLNFVAPAVSVATAAADRDSRFGREP